MSTATQQESGPSSVDQLVDRTLPLTAHEVRMLHVVLGIVMERPGTFGVRGNGSTETKRILIETAGRLRDKLGAPPPAPLAKKKAPPPPPAPGVRTPAPVPPVVVAFSAAQPPVLPAPAALAQTTPAAAPAANGNGSAKGAKHFLVVYSHAKKKPVAEREFDSPEDAFSAQRTEAAQWTDADDIETHVISGPNRKVLVSAQPKLFRARPPKLREGAR